MVIGCKRSENNIERMFKSIGDNKTKEENRDGKLY